MSAARHLLAGALLALAPWPALAASLTLPGSATLNHEELAPAGRYSLPIGPYRPGQGIETEAFSGQITRQAWRIGGTGLSTYQILLTLRAQLVDQGYEVVFDCGTDACGGFDFRFGTEVIGEPMMHVDLGDFQFLAATRQGAEGGVEAVSLLVSRSASSGFVQVVQVGGPAEVSAPEPALSTKTNGDAALPVFTPSAPGDIASAMETTGRFVLGDLVFASGAAELGAGSYGSLSALADYLKANPDKRVALVGHTDATGALAGNVALSQRRAASVMARLISDLGVPAAQLEADGVGYLAPLATNQTEDGRMLNRRVEAILVSTN